MRYGTALFIFWILTGVAKATPGGVDAYGCHHSKTDGYHCHVKKIDKIKAYIFGESQFNRSARLRAQCQGQKNEGVCFGYV